MINFCLIWKKNSFHQTFFSWLDNLQLLNLATFCLLFHFYISCHLQDTGDHGSSQHPLSANSALVWLFSGWRVEWFYSAFFTVFMSINVLVGHWFSEFIGPFIRLIFPPLELPPAPTIVTHTVEPFSHPPSDTLNSFKNKELLGRFEPTSHVPCLLWLRRHSWKVSPWDTGCEFKYC